MPLLDHFRLAWLGRAAPTAPSIGPAGRLHRVVLRQRAVRVPTEFEQKLEALESEYSQPLYDASAYGFPAVERVED